MIRLILLISFLGLIKAYSGVTNTFRSIDSRGLHSRRQDTHLLRAEPENVYTGVPNVQRYEDVTFGIMGGGAFSLALAKVLSYKNIKSRLLVRDPEVAKQINTDRYHPKYLTDCKVPDCMWATADAKEALDKVNYIVHAVLSTMGSF